MSIFIYLASNSSPSSLLQLLYSLLSILRSRIHNMHNTTLLLWLHLMLAMSDRSSTDSVFKTSFTSESKTLICCSCTTDDSGVAVEVLGNFF